MLLNELFLPKRYTHGDVIRQIAKKHGVSKEKIIAQLKAGEKVESEHTKNKAIARQIALDHLEELPDYYDKLKKAEGEVKD